MFETLPTSPATSPAQPPREPDDIFAPAGGTPPPAPASMPSAGLVSPAVSPLTQPAPAPASSIPVVHEGSRIGRIFLEILAVLAGIAIVVVGGYFILLAVRTDDTLAPTTPAQDIPSGQDQDTTEAPAIAPSQTPPPPAVPLDTDGDGLTDEQERVLGTEPFSIDTDRDGLFDGDEVNIWKTNPLIADTDGDGYTDGEEVRNGYNPNGPGKLITPAVSPTTISP